MTLCIARRISENNVELVSDSRISIGSKHFDTGIKVFAIPVRILWPKSDPEEGESIDHEAVERDESTHTLGLAVAGDTLHAYLVKETVAELLQNLQFIPDNTDLSFIEICNIVKKIFTKLAQDIDGARDTKNGITSGFFLTGYCPEQ